ILGFIFCLNARWLRIVSLLIEFNATEHAPDLVRPRQDFVHLRRLAIHQALVKPLQVADVLVKCTRQEGGVLFKDRRPYVWRTFGKSYRRCKSASRQRKYILLVLFDIQHGLSEQERTHWRKMRHN